MSEHVSSAWYADFFTELPNEFWRRAVPPEATTAEIDFVEERLGLTPGSRVVDVPCGSGRHSIALAERGHTVTGLDISAEAIEHARRTAKAAGVDVDFRLAEMRDSPARRLRRRRLHGQQLRLPRSRGHADVRRRAGRGGPARRGAGGRLQRGRRIRPARVHRRGPHHERRATSASPPTTEYDVAHSRLVSGYRFSRGAEEVAVTALHHVLTCAQIDDLLTTAGFVDIALYAGPDGEPFRLGSPRLLLTARRR